MADPITTLTAISAALSIVDKISGQIKRFWKKEPEPAQEPPHSVQAKKVDDTIVVERQGTVVQTITGNDIAKLDQNTQGLIKTFEQSIEKNYKLWKAVYPQRDASPDPVVNAQVEAKLNDLAKKFCADLGHIFKYLGSIGYELEDHYADVRYVCQQFGGQP